jgi:hypothetical protein
MTTSMTVNPGVTSWIVVQVRCQDCGMDGPSVEKEPGTRVRVTFSCHSRQCRDSYQQRQTV